MKSLVVLERLRDIISVFVKFSNFEQRIWTLAGLKSKENSFLGFLPDFPRKRQIAGGTRQTDFETLKIVF